MWTERNHERSAGAPAARRWGLRGAIDEIVGSVLDAADLDILEEFGERRGGPRSLGLELLEELLLDMLRRYLARQRRERELARTRGGS